MKRPPAELGALVQAVSGTPRSRYVTRWRRSPRRSRATRSPRRPQGAREAHAEDGSSGRRADALTGDLELFGLPGLLQSLQGSESSGELTLVDQQQQTIGTIGLAKGRITEVFARESSRRSGGLPDVREAGAGTFSFRRAAPTKIGDTFDPMQIILEGARRHDEYQRAPRDRPRRPAPRARRHSRRASGGRGERKFAAGVWDRASKGLTPDACEHEIEIDPFRVRRLYAWWIEQGALRPRTS
jgi:hypothetical protein